MTTRTALYRHFDADGQLLYIGITDDPARRLSEHVKANKWPVARVSVKWYGSREDAEGAERLFIRQERPPHNKANNPKAVLEPQGAFREAFIHALGHSPASLTDISVGSGVSRDVLNKLIARPSSSTTAENAVALARFFDTSVEQMIADAQEARK